MTVSIKNFENIKFEYTESYQGFSHPEQRVCKNTVRKWSETKI